MPGKQRLSRPGWRRVSAACAAAITALTMSIVLAPAPANAHAATESWGSFHTLCRYSGSCVTQGSIVRLWQTILYATQPWDVGPHGCSYFVDGDFGPHTANITTRYQATYRLDTDGWVGRDTWSTTFNRFVDFTSTSSYATYYRFHGPYADFNVRKVRSTGVWQFQNICGSNGYLTLTHS